MWILDEIQLPLQYAWKISRNSADSKTNFIVRYTRNGFRSRAEVAPNIRYGETPESIKAAFKSYMETSANQIPDEAGIGAVLDMHALPSALRFGMEAAYVHWQASSIGKDINDILGIERPFRLPTSYSFPIMETSLLHGFWEKHLLSRFEKLKVKVNADNALDMLKAIRKFSDQPLLIDANESWQSASEVMKFIAEAKDLNVELIEQPLPADNWAEAKALKKLSPLPVFADEAFTLHPDMNLIKECYHGVNMKLMKAGGYMNGIKLLNEAREAGLKTMVGCMIETSLGISSALRLCANVDYVDLDGFMILKEEPYGLIKEEDGMLEFA